jgi:hypothetical protein
MTGWPVLATTRYSQSASGWAPTRGTGPVAGMPARLMKLATVAVVGLQDERRLVVQHEEDVRDAIGWQT